MSEERMSALKKAYEEYDKKKAEEHSRWREIADEFGMAIIEQAEPKHLARDAKIDSEFIQEIRKIVS